MAVLLQGLFAAQARDALRLTDLSSGKPPDLAHWVAPIAQAVKPLVLQHFQAGVLASQRRIAALLAGRKPSHEPCRIHLHPEHTFAPSKGVMFDGAALHMRRSRHAILPGSQVTRAGRHRNFPPTISGGLAGRPSFYSLGNLGVVARVRKDLSFAFNLWSPKILDAVDKATMQFCRETNETATSDLATAIKQLRKLLKEGLRQGDAFKLLAEKVGRIFADPMRAYRIALTETARALHDGGLMNAKESGVVRKKEWLASAASCDEGFLNDEGCQGMDGRQVDLDKPFWVDPKGGTYSRIMVPPLHPH